MPDLQMFLLGTLVVADLDPHWLTSHILSRSPGHLGPYKEEDLLRLSGHPRRAVVDRCQARVNKSGRPGALRRTGVLIGPNRLGSLATPGPLGRATG